MIQIPKTLTLLISCLLVLGVAPLSSGQDQLPRDPDKLLVRARQFWQQLVDHRKANALEFVLPEKRDVFLGGDTLPVLEAKVVGLDFTESKERAAVRVAVKVLAPGAPTPTLWTITDRWLWQRNNWFADAASPKEIFTVMHGGLPPEEAARVSQEIGNDLKGPVEELNLGTFVKGSLHEFDIPLEYAGKWLLRAEITPVTIVFLKDHTIAPGAKAAQGRIDASNIQGQFRIPLTFRVSYDTAVVERRLTLTGTVFSPITFRQVPEGPLKKGDLLTIFVKNNTTEVAPLQYIQTGLDVEEVSSFEAIEPGGEATIVYRIGSDNPPIHIDVLFRNSIYGASQYSYSSKIP